jgi:chemotaxis protein MotB
MAELRAALQGREAEVSDTARLLAERDAALAERDAALDRVQRALAERDAALAALRTRMGETEAALAEARASLTARERALADLTAQLTEAERQRIREAAQAQALLARFEDARTEIGSLTARLTDAERLAAAEAAAAEALRKRLEEADAERIAMTLALEEERRRAQETLELLAAAEASRNQVETARADDLSEMERRRVALAQARETLSQLRAASTEDKRRLALLNQQVAELRKQLGSLQAVLDASEAKDFASQVQVQALGGRLNTALARVASQASQLTELEAERLRLLEAEAQDLRKARSDFFARTREILGNVEGIRVEGDRFVFASEVLFPIGSADLSAAGRAQIARVADVIRQVQPQIPEGIDWILRIDGHTDRTGDTLANWELSQARALSVVRYLIDNERIDPRRLAANGFGEYQPIDPGSSPAALARNRRIELKFTER